MNNQAIGKLHGRTAEMMSCRTNKILNWQARIDTHMLLITISATYVLRVVLAWRLHVLAEHSN